MATATTQCPSCGEKNLYDDQRPPRRCQYCGADLNLQSPQVAVGPDKPVAQEPSGVSLEPLAKLIRYLVIGAVALFGLFWLPVLVALAFLAVPPLGLFLGLLALAWLLSEALKGSKVSRKALGKSLVGAAATLAAIALALLVANPFDSKGGMSSAQVEQRIRWYITSHGGTFRSLDCPQGELRSNGDSLRCVAVGEGGESVDLIATEEEGRVHITSP